MVLGPSLSVIHARTAEGIPVEQALCRKRLRPGSGFLSVRITTDGPTRVLQIVDTKVKVISLFLVGVVTMFRLERLDLGKVGFSFGGHITFPMR